MGIDLGQAAIALGASILASGLALALIRLTSKPSRPASDTLFRDTGDQVLFLFDGETLVDCTPQARALLSASPIRGGDWLRLAGFLAPRFTDIEAALQSLPISGKLELSSSDNGKSLFLDAEFVGGLTRIVLSSQTSAGKADKFESLAHHAMAGELALLRQVASLSPNPIWQESAATGVVWANSAYFEVWAKAHPAEPALCWPLPRLFEPPDAEIARKCVVTASGERQCYDVTVRHLGTVSLCFAASADTTIRAETTLQSFMQTLTKTFAQLPIGLAIFDRERRLQLFNPALADLTGLAVDFLSMRPSLLSVLDALRERKMLPEPKDYRSWRRQVVEMEKAASSGQYEETWSLPDGQTYRVIGRPHPNGALALMIEDISTEILRSRRYRADLELGQSVIDEIDTALAVFSPSGQLVMSNNAYVSLWGHDFGECIVGGSVQGLSEHWRAQTAPSALWSEVEDYVVTIGDRTGWQAEARLLDGRLLTCRFSPLAGGATLAAFRPSPSIEAGHPRLADGVELRSA